MTILKSSKEINFLKLGEKMIKKKIILLMLKNDVIFKSVVSGFENTT
jgi:hypothetical protein